MSGHGDGNEKVSGTSTAESGKEHVLLTVLGMNPTNACYFMNNQYFRTKFAPIALLHLLPKKDKPDHIKALCTPQASKGSFPHFRDSLKKYCVEEVKVPAGDEKDAVNSYLAAVSEAIPENIELTVDVTHGFRHFSFLTYIAVLYLAAFRGIRVRGAYYGMLTHNAPSPFLDLRPLLVLPRWLYALETLRDTGSTLPMARFFGDGSRDQNVKNIYNVLSDFSDGYLSGLPLELGHVALDIRKRGHKELRRQLKKHKLPLADELVDRLDGMIKPFTLTDQKSVRDWKSETVLDEDELKRQARIINNLLKHQNIATALGLMNEWTVSWVVFHLSKGKKWLKGKEWLGYTESRRSAAGLLNAITAVGKDNDLKDKFLTEQQRKLGDFWGKLSSLRNSYHHHGMRLQVLKQSQTKGQFQKDLYVIRDYWTNTLSQFPTICLKLGPSSDRRILISPIGNRPGVLFSALRTCTQDPRIGKPTLCLVICSDATKADIDVAARRADYQGSIRQLWLADPYGGGKEEIERLKKESREQFIGADEVLVNITGGTTLMRLTADALANAARQLACPVRRFGLIDRRTHEQQVTEPYRMGEPFWLDSMEQGDADSN